MGHVGWVMGCYWACGAGDGACGVGDGVCGVGDGARGAGDGALWGMWGGRWGAMGHVGWVMGCVGWGRCRATGGTRWGHRAVTPQVTVVSDGDEVGAARARGDVEKADVVDGES